jgi:hypothetical protein
MPKIVVKTDNSLLVNEDGAVCVRLSENPSNQLFFTGTGELSILDDVIMIVDYYPINSISGDPASKIKCVGCSSAVSRLASVGDSNGDIFNTGETGDISSDGVNTVNLINAIAGEDVRIQWWTKEEYQKTTNMGVTPSA